MIKTLSRNHLFVAVVKLADTSLNHLFVASVGLADTSPNHMASGNV